MDSSANTPQPARDFVGPHQDVRDLADELHLQLHALADHKDVPEDVQATPFNRQAFLQNVFKLVSLAAPYVPGVAGQILTAVLPIVSSAFGVTATLASAE